MNASVKEQFAHLGEFSFSLLYPCYDFCLAGVDFGVVVAGVASSFN